MIEFHDVSVRYDGDDRDRPLAAPTSPSPRASWPSWSGPPAAGSPPCCAASTGWCRTSPAARCSGRSSSTGRDTRTHRPRDLADVVGFVVQDPLASFVTDTVEEEIAYGMEALGVEATAMRRRVEETLDLLGLADLRGRSAAGPLRRPAAAGGDRGRARRRSADPRARRADLGARPGGGRGGPGRLHRLVHDLGITVVVAEHRLERVIHHADRVLLVSDGRASPLLEPAEAMGTSTRLPSGHRAGPGHRLDAAPAVGARRPSPRRRPADGPRRARAPGRAGARRRRRVGARAPARRTTRPGHRPARRRPRPGPGR